MKDDCVFITDTLGDIREVSSKGVGAIWGYMGVPRVKETASRKAVSPC